MPYDSPMRSSGQKRQGIPPYYALCNDVELIRQPYGAAIWKNSIGDFAVTNHTGRMILETCARGSTLDDVLYNMSSLIDVGFNYQAVRFDVEEFLESAENIGHVFRNSQETYGTGSVTGSVERLSLVRADLSITWSCNLHCSYCYAGEHTRSEELSTKEWQQAFNILCASGVKKFIITGGEPFARSDMLSLLQTVNDLDISITLLTNGTLVDKTLIRELQRIKQLREIKVSLDSVTSRDFHDCFRGSGTWDAAIRTMRSLHEHGIKVVVNMTIHPLNSGELISAVEECAKNGWLLEVSPVVLEGLAKKDHLLKPNKLVQYRQDYSRALVSFPETLRVNESEIAPEWEPSFRCAVLFGTIGVSPDGKLKPCLRSEGFFGALHPVFDQVPSVIDFDPVEIESLKFFKMIKQVRSAFVPQPEACGGCEFLHGTCNGCVVAKSFMENVGCCPRKEVS